MSEQDRQNLIAILEQKQEWLGRMLTLTLEFGEQLLRDDVEAFSSGLDQRQDMIAKIESFVQMERSMPYEDDAQIARIRESTRKIIQKILEADEKNAALATSKIKQYKQQIKSLNEQKKGNTYTRAYEQTEAVYFDSKK